MPELPEVETMVRGIRPHVEGRRLRELRICPCACRPIRLQPAADALIPRVRGKTIARVRRLAKRIVLDLSSGDSFVIEPRMTGLMLLADPPSVEHLRIEWRFRDRGEYSRLWFWDRRGLGTVRLLSAEQLAQLESGGSLGPDALTRTASDWAAACGKTSRAIKVALLDQKLAAGIGNLYASEILHVARIAPQTPANALTRPQIVRLTAAVRAVLEDAILHEGSTLGDGTYRNALNQDGGYQNVHRVYARADETCRTCGRGTVRRIVQAQRSTFFCPQCQRLSKRSTPRPS